MTRERILELGEQLLLTKGYNAFSYQDIAKALGIKNAAIHYYFAKKENLGTSIVKTNVQRFEEMVDNMQSLQFDERKQLDRFVKIYLKSHREKKLCLVGALGSDLETLSESTKMELQKLTSIILDWLTGILASGQAKGLFRLQGQPNNIAEALFAKLVGSLKLSRIIVGFDYKGMCLAIQDELKP